MGSKRLRTIIAGSLPFAIVIVAPVAVRHVPGAWGARIAAGFGVAVEVAFIALGLIVLACFSSLSRRALRCRALPSGPAEQPLLGPPKLDLHGSSRPVVLVTGIAHEAGTSTLAANLAILLATYGILDVEGERRRPRPVCLLSEGRLAESLGLTTEPLEGHAAAWPQQAGRELPNLATRHASGCEFFCLGSQGKAAGSVSRLVSQLRQLYDAVVIDCPPDAGHLDLPGELLDIVLLVATPATPEMTIARAADRTLRLHRESRTALIVNQVHAGLPAPAWVRRIFPHMAELPDDRIAARLDWNGLPWGLRRSGEAARTLFDMTSRIFPTMFEEGSQDAVASVA